MDRDERVGGLDEQNLLDGRSSTPGRGRALVAVTMSMPIFFRLSHEYAVMTIHDLDDFKLGLIYQR